MIWFQAKTIFSTLRTATAICWEVNNPGILAMSLAMVVCSKVVEIDMEELQLPAMLWNSKEQIHSNN